MVSFPFCYKSVKCNFISKLGGAQREDDNDDDDDDDDDDGGT